MRRGILLGLAVVALAGCKPRDWEGGGTAVGNPARLSVRVPELVASASAGQGWLLAERCDGLAAVTGPVGLDLVSGEGPVLPGGELCTISLAHGAVVGDVSAPAGTAVLDGPVTVDGGAWVLELGEPGGGVADGSAGLFLELTEDGQLDPVERSQGPFAVGSGRQQVDPVPAEGLLQVGLDGAVALRTGPDDPTYDGVQGALALAEVAFGDGVWVAVGGDGTLGVSWISEDGGLTWTEHAHAGSLNGVAFANGRFVASSIFGTLEAWDGSWRPLTAPQLGYKSVAGGAGGFVAPAQDQVAFSADGETWVDAVLPGIVGFGGAAATWAGDRWVVVGDLGYRAVSLDGTTWTDPTSGGNTLGDVAWNGSEVVAVGASEVWRSVDGVVWTAGEPLGLTALATFRGQVVGLDAEGRLYADDAGSWVEWQGPVAGGWDGLGTSAP